MKRVTLLMTLSAACMLGQSLDLSSLDRLASKAKEVNRVSLNQDQLHAALQMMPAGEGSAKNTGQMRRLVAGLSNVQVRTFEFAPKGQYSDGDLNAIRTQMERMKGWAKIIDSKEENGHAEVFMLTDENKPMGIAVIDAEPQEVSVVFIKGSLRLADLGSLGGVMGLPRMQLGPQPRPNTEK
ncbi:MAG TPA: DUF4252 domain-containing protein [Bryobacteraceae bacterium]